MTMLRGTWQLYNHIQSLIWNGYSIFKTPMIGKCIVDDHHNCPIETVPFMATKWAPKKPLGRASCCSCFVRPKDVSQLRLSLLLNSAMCHLKQKEPEKTLQARKHGVNQGENQWGVQHCHILIHGNPWWSMIHGDPCFRFARKLYKSVARVWRQALMVSGWWWLEMTGT